MRRDFSEKSREELLGLVKQVEDEQLCEFTDWLGDGWYGFEAWIGKLDVQKYVDNVNAYHKKVIDKNDTTAKDIETIFKNVNTHSTNYRSRFAALLTDLQAYKQLLNTISDVVAPGNGRFNSEYIGGGLKEAVNTYFDNSELLMEICGDGLDSTEAGNVEDQERLLKLMDTYSSVLIAFLPDVEIGQRYEMPIGPDTVVYYEVKAKVDCGNDSALKVVVEDQKVKLDGISAEAGGKLKIGGEADGESASVSVSSDSSSVSFDVKGELTGSASVKIDNDTYTITWKYDSQSFTLEESVTTEVDGGSVTSTVGITKRQNDWPRLPDPEPVTVPYPGSIPELNIDWEEVVIIGTLLCVVYAGVYVVVGVYTGGASCTVLPPPVFA